MMHADNLSLTIKLVSMEIITYIVGSLSQLQKPSYDGYTTSRWFVEGEPLWAWNFHQGPCWCCATVTECLGNVLYKVQLEEQADVIWQRHANQLHTRIVPVNMDTDNPNTSDESAKPVVNIPHPLCRSSQVYKPINQWAPYPEILGGCGIWLN